MTLAKRLYELQQIDMEIQKKQETLDDVSRQLGESEALLGAKTELLAEEEHLARMDKQQRDVEWEVEDLRGSIARLNEKLYGGKVKNPKELLSLEQEVEIFKVKLRQKEDSLLDLMAEVEAMRDEIELDTGRLRKLEGEWQQEQGILAQKRTEIESQLSDLSQKRQTLTFEISSQALELYDGIRLRKGQAVVKVEQGMCQGCRLTLPMSEWQQARAGTLVQCSSCGRILYLG
ncbi:MAG TPA: hypothetical protein G4O12_06850 [Dehalococcoidia bacterium]|nr:hypothetical protein [Dehalococcoidia bacterium]